MNSNNNSLKTNINSIYWIITSISIYFSPKLKEFRFKRSFVIYWLYKCQSMIFVTDLFAVYIRQYAAFVFFSLHRKLIHPWKKPLSPLSTFFSTFSILSILYKKIHFRMPIWRSFYKCVFAPFVQYLIESNILFWIEKRKLLALWRILFEGF